MSSVEFAVRWKERVPLARFARQYGIPGVIVFALLMLRRHEQLMHPQVWDEDGTIVAPYLIEQ